MSSDPGAGPFPAVLDLYTFGGGLSEKRGSLLASRGFVVLTVALYGHDDMARNIKEVHLDYFEEAIQLLRRQDKVICLNRSILFICSLEVLKLEEVLFSEGKMFCSSLKRKSVRHHKKYYRATSGFFNLDRDLFSGEISE